MNQYDHLCPWCQTEIVWDPEIGPEETCPHCFNELGDYRSVSLKVQSPEEQLDDETGQPDDEDFDDDDLEDLEDDGAFDEYEEGVQRVLDTQEEAPECSTCRSFMLFAGSQAISAGFVPAGPASLKQPLLKPSQKLKVYVCPACFKVEHMLDEEERSAMVDALREFGKTE